MHICLYVCMHIVIFYVFIYFIFCVISWHLTTQSLLSGLQSKFTACFVFNYFNENADEAVGYEGMQICWYVWMYVAMGALRKGLAFCEITIYSQRNLSGSSRAD